MLKLKDKFSQAYASAQTMTKEEKKLNSIIQKLVLKKSIIPLVCMLLIAFTGIALKLNIWLVLGFELVSAILTYKYMQKQANKLNNFTYYAGNVLSIEDKGSHSVIILKQGKMPIKLQVKYGKDSFANLKKNQFIKVGYNKESEIASILK